MSSFTTSNNLCYVVEATTDVRLVEGLSERCALVILGRKSDSGYIITHPPKTPVCIELGPASRTAFAKYVWKYLTTHRHNVSHVIVQGYGLAAIAANLAGRITGTPTYMLVCSPVEAYYRCRRVAQGKPFRHIEYLSIIVAARVNALLGKNYLALSEHLADVVRSHGGHGKISQAPIYGIDTDVFLPPHQPKLVIRAELGLPVTGSLIFFSSRIAPEKDSDTLLQAFRRLREGGRDVWLLNRSGGYKGILALAEKHGVGDRVIATDAAHPYRELPLSYQASDVCVQASREEGLGFSPLESLACGTPVVAAAVGGLRETIKDGETGWTYPVGDSETLAQQIEAILDDPGEAQRRTQNGHTLVEKSYSKAVVYDRLMQIMNGPTDET